MGDFSFYEHVKSRYDLEFERRKELRQGVRLTATLATVLSGAVFGLASTSPAIDQWQGAITLALLFFAGLYLIAAIYYASVSHVGHAYVYIGSTSELFAIRFRDRASGTQWSQIDISTEVTLEKEYSDCASLNQTTNDAKSGYLHRANVKLLSSMCFLIAAGMVTICDKVAR